MSDQNPWWTGRSVGRAASLPGRDLQPEILKRVENAADRRAMVLLGPRQVGKTTLLKQVARDLIKQGLPPPNILYFDFSDDRLTTRVSPRDLMKARPAGRNADKPSVYLLDEVGSSGDWSRWLKQAVDAEGARIVVTDSAAALLRTGGRESVLGRWDEFVLEPLTYDEFLRLKGVSAADEKARSPDPLADYLRLGGFPEHIAAADFDDVRRRLREDTASRAISKDMERHGVEVARVLRFFAYVAQESGAELNIPKRARDLDADPRSVREWLRLLEESVFVQAIERTTSRASARLRAPRKVYLADHGLVHAFAAASDPLGDPRVRSRAFEAVVFRHLREVARRRHGRITYYRDDDQREVDFVLDGDNSLTLVEATTSESPDRAKAATIAKVALARSARRSLLVHGGPLRDDQSPVRRIPLRGFLLSADRELFG